MYLCYSWNSFWQQLNQEKFSEESLAEALPKLPKILGSLVTTADLRQSLTNGE